MVFSTEGSDFDTVLTVYLDPTNALGGLIEVRWVLLVKWCQQIE